MCKIRVGVPKIPVPKYHYGYHYILHLFEGSIYFAEHHFEGWYLFQGGIQKQYIYVIISSQSVKLAKLLCLLVLFQIRSIVNNKTQIEDWIVDKVCTAHSTSSLIKSYSHRSPLPPHTMQAKHRRSESDETFEYPYDLGTWKNFIQV